MGRIARGIEKFVIDYNNSFIAPGECSTPFITECTKSPKQRKISADEPLRTYCNILRVTGECLSHHLSNSMAYISSGSIFRNNY